MRDFSKSTLLFLAHTIWFEWFCITFFFFLNRTCLWVCWQKSLCMGSVVKQPRGVSPAPAVKETTFSWHLPDSLLARKWRLIIASKNWWPENATIFCKSPTVILGEIFSLSKHLPRRVWGQNTFASSSRLVRYRASGCSGRLHYCPNSALFFSWGR